MLQGIGVSKGYGRGNAVIIEDMSLNYSSVKFTTGEEEKARLKDAVEAFTAETIRLAEKLKSCAGEKEAEILEGHLTMLADEVMLSKMYESIDGGAVAEAAVDAVCTVFYDMFSDVYDETTRQRASDVKDIRDSLIRILLGVKNVDITLVPEGSVLVAGELTPSMISRINKANVSAIVTEVGGATSHSAILTRAMGIPAVFSVFNATRIIKNGETLVVDGINGKVLTSPNKAEFDEYSVRQKGFLNEKEELKAYLNKTTITKSGVKKKVYGNIGKAEDVGNVIKYGGEGIGLFRTELLFSTRDREPTEEEQLEAYSTVAKAMDGKEVIIRTLDIGGDKTIDYLKAEKEDNPFLGLRAIRYCLKNTELFKKQLRALLRAAYCGNIKIMLPLVSSLNEVKETKALIMECAAELENEGLNYRIAPLGVMIETPSAALISDLLAKEVDFFSIGTNDLTGYTMAVDRGNANVGYLYEVFQMSVLRAIEMTIKNAKAQGITVGVCGEAAADRRLIPLLVKWGIDEISVSPSSILSTRKNICECE